MMDTRRYVFVGNRAYILKEMIGRGLDIVKVFVMENSFLHRLLLEDAFVDYLVITNKRGLIEELNSIEYDVLISNGCKYILPVSKLNEAKYVNIHPSYLPDLKGLDPINGACLYNRTAGAACHLMDDGIDTGRIIARIAIDMSDEIDAGLLFQLSFKAEVQAFIEAYENNFIPMSNQPEINDAIYYTISPDDLLINFSKGAENVIRQANAFGYRSKGAWFECAGVKYKFFKASFIDNKFVSKLAKDVIDLEVFISFENTIVFKLEGKIIRFDQIVYENSTICEGDIISSIS